MKVILYSAISADGFIANLDGNSDWTDDDELFDVAVKQWSCIVLGRTTYEQFAGDIYPLAGVQHIILSHGALEVPPNVHRARSVDEALDRATQLGFKEVLLIGGAKTNESFARAERIDELILDVHPLTLGTGLRLLGNYNEALDLELQTSGRFGQLVQNHYQVRRGR